MDYCYVEQGSTTGIEPNTRHSGTCYAELRHFGPKNTLSRDPESTDVFVDGWFVRRRLSRWDEGIFVDAIIAPEPSTSRRFTTLEARNCASRD